MARKMQSRSLLISTALTCFPVAAVAQTLPEDPASQVVESSSALTNIVVMTQRRSKNVQKSPVSISV